MAPEKFYISSDSMPGISIIIAVGILISRIQLFDAILRKQLFWMVLILEFILTQILVEFFTCKLWSETQKYMTSLVKMMLHGGNLMKIMRAENIAFYLASVIAITIIIKAMRESKPIQKILQLYIDHFN